MRTTTVLITLLLAILLVIGCGKKENAGETNQTTDKEAETMSGDVTQNVLKQIEAMTLPDLETLTWQQMPDGPEYVILQDGEGDAVAAGKMTSMHYIGWLTDGKRFDSSIPRGEPLVFKLGAGQVISGWDKGIDGMQRGEKRLLRIPPELGYGSRGFPGAIPPNSTLVFYVELVDFK